jgi:hypothetical protein
MFLARYDGEFLKAKLLPRDQWRPFPPASDRHAWDGLLSAPLNQERKADLVKKATALLGSPWPPLPATLYMEFQRNGNRTRYEAPYFTRRQNLAVLVLAECMVNDGRFLDEIVNGLWCILEELTWCIPAHAGHGHKTADDPLPAQDPESVDLYACETAMVMAQTLYLLREPLDALSPSLCQRVREAIIKRVVVPVETRTDFWWLIGVNNWTPWCTSNVLGAAMFVLDDPDRLVRLTLKLMQALDRFIDRYGDDGGCNEGPGYWGVAAGAMLIFLELLYSRFNGAVDIYREPRIRKMGHFIVTAHLAGPWFMNFADASARGGVNAPVAYQYGRRAGDKNMQDIALLSERDWHKNNPVRSLSSRTVYDSNISQMLRELFWMPTDEKPAELRYPLTAWLPDLQVMVARESEADGRGMVLSAKGGHNDENHNHNDIGQFIVLVDGQPGIVDVGVETYTKQTFSPKRYDIWCIRSSAHNVPLVNGIEQAPGRDFQATHLDFGEDGDGAHLAMNLESAYPAKAGIRSWRREFQFRRSGGAQVIMRDSFELAPGIASDILVPFFSHAKVTILDHGRILINTQPTALIMTYPSDSMEADIEIVPLADPKLSGVWGPELYRIELRYTGGKSKGSYELVFQPRG